MNRILIVEDEPAISNLIQMNLAAAGYCCVCAFDGAKAAEELLFTSRREIGRASCRERVSSPV